jgi:hypothetical protein
MSKEDKLERANVKISELETELAAYKEFFEASLAMNIAAASLPAAKRTHDALRACEVVRIRAGVRTGGSALDALKNISDKE